MSSLCSQFLNSVFILTEWMFNSSFMSGNCLFQDTLNWTVRLCTAYREVCVVDVFDELKLFVLQVGKETIARSVNKNYSLNVFILRLLLFNTISLRSFGWSFMKELSITALSSRSLTPAISRVLILGNDQVIESKSSDLLFGEDLLRTSRSTCKTMSLSKLMFHIVKFLMVTPWRL